MLENIYTEVKSTKLEDSCPR